MFKINFYIFLALLFSKFVISKPIEFDGLSKLTLNDIQSITPLDIYSNDLEIFEVNNIIKDLTISDLIYEVSFKETSDYYSIIIKEADLIEDIYVNNNVWIKENLIIENLNS